MSPDNLSSKGLASTDPECQIASEFMPQTPSDTAVLVVSCDAYQDVWHAFFHCYFKYWPDNPYPTYLVSNHTAYADPRVRPILVGEDRDWSSNLLQALERLETPRVMLFLEDFFLTERVDTARVLRLERLLVERQAACLRLFPEPGPDAPLPGAEQEHVGTIGRDAGWRVSTQTAFWQKDALSRLLVRGESAWQFEIAGSERSRGGGDPFLSVEADQAAVSILFWAIMRGRWTDRGLRHCRREGVAVDLSRRPRERWTTGLSSRPARTDVEAR